MISFLRYVFVLLFLAPLTLKAQQMLQLTVRDTVSGKPLPGAMVRICAAGDTALLRSALTDQQGKVSFSNISNGKYDLQIHSLGYQDRQQRVSVPGSWPETMLLTPGLQLKEITIREDIPPVRMKGDTIEYNAAKFKTKDNAVVEDLLRKLPGVKVDRDGSIKAQGEDVQRVLVDGKEFFGSDPSVATRNLPADMIDKVQVLDKQSDMAEFTGVADGQQTKTINLVTKKNRKKGYFGNVSAGAGSNGRYEGGFNVNSFTGDMQLSALLKGNNVNKSGFNPSELLKMIMQNKDMLRNLPPSAMSELARMKGVRLEGSQDALAEIVRPSGLTDTRFGGLNFNNDWRNLKLRSSYFFNDNHTRQEYNYARQYRLQDTAYNYLQSGTTRADNINHRADLSGDFKINDRTSLKVSPHLDVTRTQNQGERSYSSWSADGLRLLNTGTQFNSSDFRQQLLTTDILLRHRLPKKGRTIMLNVKPEYFHSDGTSYNRSTSDFYNLPKGPKQEIIDQQRKDKAEIYSVNTNVVYTEPLSRTHSLQIGQQLYYSQGDYQRLVQLPDAAGHYTAPDRLFSDQYEAQQLQYTGKMLLSGNHKRLLYTVGAGWQQSSIDGHSGMKGYHVNGRYQALLPEAYAEWKTGKHDKLIFRYDMQTSRPSVSELQPLEDNSDPLYIRRGNPLLEQRKSQHAGLTYNSFRLNNNNSLFAKLDATYYNTDIADSSSIDLSSGKQSIVPVNVSGNYLLAAAAGKSMGLGKNGSSFTVGLTTSLAKNTTFTNGLSNIIRTFSITPDMNVNYYLGDHVSLTARGSAAWNKRSFSGASLLPESNWLLMYGLEGIVTLPWKITLEGSLDGFSSLGMAAGYNNTILLVNTAVGKEIGNRFTLRAEVRDLLNRNESVNRINGNGYIEDRRNNALGRFFLLSAGYKLKHFAKSKNK
ncbi:outer membrane beta-barrel protein [Chitinophaga solisilvae]|uniref:outer membrane beta-barrel protein n=1 Tax=Chitinophaga solisilvae TaxID=1233460 RepID=UPI00136B64BF|nr:outer membrane beta-barrel protein [Chitinophaga solisilvae]